MAMYTNRRASHLFKAGSRRVGQDKFRRKRGGVEATQYVALGSRSTAVQYSLQFNPKFTAIILASIRIAVP